MYEYSEKITVPEGKELILMPFGDIQSDTLLPKLQRIVERMVSFKAEGHVFRAFGLGDLFETWSPSERAKKAGANYHDTTIDRIRITTRGQADEVASYLMPIKGDIMTIGSGHHYDEVKLDGGMVVNSDQYIADKLGAQYAGNGIQWINLLVNGIPFSIMAMHGYGSARTPGARLNKRIEMIKIVPTANWYAMAHDNSMVSDPRQVLAKRADGSTRYVKQYFSGIGCLQLAYEMGIEAGYAEQLALPPACIGFVRMHVWPVRDGEHNDLEYELRV